MYSGTLPIAMRASDERSSAEVFWLAYSDSDYRMHDGEGTSSSPAFFTKHHLGSPMSWKPSSWRPPSILAQQDYPMRDISPASSFTRHFLGSPMSWQPSPLHSSWKPAYKDASNSPSFVLEEATPMHTVANTNTQYDIDFWGKAEKDQYACCGQRFQDLSALITHYEEEHSVKSNNPILTPEEPSPFASPSGSLVSTPLSGDPSATSTAHDTNSTGHEHKPAPHSNLGVISPSAALYPFMTRNTPETLTATSETIKAAFSRSSTPSAAAKPFRCPKKNCNKAYKQANGLKYHIAHGFCSSTASTEAEQAELRPFACGIGQCPKRFRNNNGIRYHRQHHDHRSDSHLETDQKISPITASHVDPLSGTTDLTEEVVRATDFASQGGSYADIFLGYYQSDSRPRTKVAIKIIRTHIYKDSDKDKLLKRLTREISIWASLKHPNVLPLLGTAANFGPVVSMVCPWMEKGDLVGYLSKNADNLTRKTRVDICEDIANGLQYLHSKHIIHRDLTTANVLMDSDCKARLSDFGLSNVIAELRGASFMTSKMAGSARWAAPELFPPDDSVPESNFSTDIYSLGSVMFHVMSGKVPYEGLTETQVMLQVLANNPPPTPTESKLAATDSFWDIVNQCWHEIPASRPTVAEVGQMIALQHLS